MEIVFDHIKSCDNFIKHGISLEGANFFDWQTAHYKLDDRRDYGEKRIIGTSNIGQRLHVIVFTIRHGDYRIISLRKANKRERNRHEKR